MLLERFKPEFQTVIGKIKYLKLNIDVKLSKYCKFTRHWFKVYEQSLKIGNLPLGSQYNEIINQVKIIFNDAIEIHY